MNAYELTYVNGPEDMKLKQAFMCGDDDLSLDDVREIFLHDHVPCILLHSQSVDPKTVMAQQSETTKQLTVASISTAFSESLVKATDQYVAEDITAEQLYTIYAAMLEIVTYSIAALIKSSPCHIIPADEHSASTVDTFLTTHLTIEANIYTFASTIAQVIADFASTHVSSIITTERLLHAFEPILSQALRILWPDTTLHGGVMNNA